MSRPRVFEGRVTVAYRFDPALRDRLNAEAKARGVSANVIVERAVGDYLDHLVPLDKLLGRVPEDGQT